MLRVRLPAAMRAPCLALAAGIAACSACPGEETLAEHEGPPRATLVRVHGFHGRGRLGGVDDYAELRVATEPVQKVHVCESPRTGNVVVEPGGARVAASCGGPWKMLWLEDAAPALVFCDLPDDPSAEWSNAPSPFNDPLRPIRCAGAEVCADDSCTFGRVRDLLRGAGDVAALEELVREGTELHDTTLDLWAEAWEALPAAARERVEAPICGALTDRSASPLRTAHALLVCPLTASSTLDTLEHKLDALTRHERRPLDGSDTLARWGVLALLPTRPAAAVKWACALLQQGDGTLLTVLATSDTPCSGAQGASSPGYGFCCGDAPCEVATIEALVANTTARWRDAPVPRRSLPPREPMLTDNVAWLAVAAKHQLLKPAQIAARCRP